MRGRQFIILVVLFFCACPTLGTIHFKDGLTHNIDYRILDLVYVDYQTPEMYTTVNCLDGALISGLYGCETSRINISGGTIRGTVCLNDYSQGNISGSAIHHGSCNNYSQLDISGDSIIGSFDSRHYGHVNISGGSIESLDSWDSSQISISGGSVEYLSSWDSSQISISGGTISERIYCRSLSQVDITGGLIEGDLRLAAQGQITIFGSDFAVDGQPFGFGELTSFGYSLWDEPYRHLNGTLLNGGIIDVDFRIHDGAKIILVPEPASAMILGLGSLIVFLRRKR